MKLWFKKFYLNILKNYTQINLSKNMFDHTNFNTLQYLIIFTLMSILLSSFVIHKMSHWNILSLCLFSLLLLINVVSLFSTLMFIKIINHSYHIVKKESQNAIISIENQILELEKEKIIKEKNYLNNQLNVIKTTSKNNKPIKKI